MTRLAVFSPVRLFGDALVACLETQPNITEVVGCRSAVRLIEDVVKFAPDVVLFDVYDENALQEAKTLNSAIPEVPLLALAIPETSEQAIAFADAGFMGYVPRHASFEDLCKMVQMAKQGECACHPRVARSLLREFGRRRQQPPDLVVSESLTQRESEILRMLGRGYSNKEIARELNLSLSTVKNHVHSILRKLNAKCRAEAVSRLRDEPWLAYSA